MQTVLIFGSALLAFNIAVAQAGPCAIEIDSLTKTLASRDAGSGPISGTHGTTSGPSQTAQHPPTAAMGQAAQGGATSPEDVRRQTAGQATAAQQGAATGAAAQHPPTAAMTQATQGQAAPATSGQHPPTAAMTQATQSQAATADNAGRQVAGAYDVADAGAALARARDLDRQGNEAACMQALDQAKQLSSAK